MERPEPILFTKTNCQKCQFVKGKIHDERLGAVRTVDAEGPEGAAELAFYDLTSGPVTLPLLVVPDREDAWAPGEVVGLNSKAASLEILNKLREISGTAGA